MGFIGDFRRTASAFAAKPAFDGGDGTLGYADLARRVDWAAAGLAARGVGPGSVVGVAIADEIEHMVATLAVLAAGGGQVTLATYDTAELRARIAAASGVTHVVAEGPRFEVADRPSLMWRDMEHRGAPLPTWIGGPVLLRTSGSTGGIKLVSLSDARLALQSRFSAGAYANRRQMRAASVEHNLAKRHALYSLWAGGTLVLRPRAATRVDLGYCRDWRVDLLDIGYVHAMSLLTTAGAPATAPELEIRLSGTLIPQALRQALRRRLGCAVSVRYSATECGTLAITDVGADPRDGVGRPVEGVTLEVVDAEGRPVATGETGEIRARTPGMADCYLDAPADTAVRFRDGWFWPGDIGHFAPDGRLVVSGRKDDMIIMSGINVFPAEVEDALLAHPAVHMAAAVGLPSDVFGRIPVAAVQLREAAQATESDLLDFARDRLALRAPRGIAIVPSLPRDPSGKIIRREVAAMFETRGGAK